MIDLTLTVSKGVQAFAINAVQLFPASEMLMAALGKAS